MERIRHCCQNLNLFPYLLYTLENSKSHPIAKKISYYVFDLMIKKIIERVAFIYTSIHHMLLSSVKRKPPLVTSIKPQPEKTESQQRKIRLCRPQKSKPKPISPLLVIAVYLAPLILAMQLVGIGSMLLFGKHTPGFIFLISALFLLAYIAIKIMFHSKKEVKNSKQKRRKIE